MVWPYLVINSGYDHLTISVGHPHIPCSMFCLYNVLYIIYRTLLFACVVLESIFVQTMVVTLIGSVEPFATMNSRD